MTESDTPQSQDSTKYNAQEAENSGQRSRPTDAQQATKTDHCYAHPYHAEPRSRWGRIVDNIDWSQVVLDVLLIIIGIKLACIYSGQLDQMIESNKIGRNGLQSVQRAFVTWRRVEITPIIGPNPKQAIGVQFDFGWENAGSTPAKSVTQHISTRWAAEPIPNDFDFHDEWLPGADHRNNPTYIGPKGFLGGGVFVVPANVLKQVYSSEVHVNYWGWVKYVDVFSQRHITESCVELKSNGTSFDLKSGFPFHLEECPRHNCSDEDCTIKH